MTRAAAHALARRARHQGLEPDTILPMMDDPVAAAEVAVAVGIQAQPVGVATVTAGQIALLEEAPQKIRAAQEANRVMAALATTGSRSRI